MAKATLQPPATYKVVLELSKDEAETLTAILAKVGGPSEGRRGFSQSIYNALVNAGVGRGVSILQFPAYQDLENRRGEGIDFKRTITRE